MHEDNKKIVNFLDVKLNLITGKYQPYSKPNNTPLYVHSKSNHPPSVLCNIPLSINKRLTEMSSDQDSFEQPPRHISKPLTKVVITTSYVQFKHPLSLTTNRTIPREAVKEKLYGITHHINTKNISTNVEQSFLKIIDEEFPADITHYTRYSTVIQSRLVTAVCQTSSKYTMDTTNPRCPQFPARVALTCVVALVCVGGGGGGILLNFRQNLQISDIHAPPDFRHWCPLSNKCITESVVYQATVTIKDNTSNIPPQTYVGLTENSFKTRLANHKSSFNSFDKRNATELTKYTCAN